MLTVPEPSSSAPRAGSRGEIIVHGILMGAYDGQGQGEVADFGLESSNEEGLGERVREEVEGICGCGRESP